MEPNETKYPSNKQKILNKSSSTRTVNSTPCNMTPWRVLGPHPWYRRPQTMLFLINKARVTVGNFCFKYSVMYIRSQDNSV